MPNTAPPDQSIRAMTGDRAFRVIVVRSTRLVREICAVQGLTGLSAQTMGDLLTGTILFRETMSPGLRVQGIVRSSDPKLALIADSAAEGATRGLVQGAIKSPFVPGDGTFLHMMRTLQNGSLNQGIVRISDDAAQPSVQSAISRGMMAYMKESEQVDTMLTLCTRIDPEGQVLEAGGFMVQLLPEVGRGPLFVMTERLEDFQIIDHLLVADFDPQTIMDELLYGMDFTKLNSSPLQFACWCSENRLLSALATLDKSEIQDLVSSDEPLEIDCEYCHKQYVIQAHRLSGLLSPN
jgi:molecular chaperone Hsp33